MPNVLLLIFALLSGDMPSTASPTITYRAPLDHELTAAECGRLALETGTAFIREHGLEGKYGLSEWRCGPIRDAT